MVSQNCSSPNTGGHCNMSLPSHYAEQTGPSYRPHDAYRKPSGVEQRTYLPTTARFEYPDRHWNASNQAPALPPPRMLTEKAQYTGWSPSVETLNARKRGLVSEVDHRIRADMYRDQLPEPYARNDVYFAPSLALPPVGSPDVGDSNLGRRWSSIQPQERMDSARTQSKPVRSVYPSDSREVPQPFARGAHPSSSMAWHHRHETPEAASLAHMPLPMPLPAPMEVATTAAPHRHVGENRFPPRNVHFDTAPEPTGFSSQALPQPLQPYRKRLRISRACDECRRRKTRCDVVGAFPGEPDHPLTKSGAVPLLEPNDEPKGDMLILKPCINCRRSDVLCSYSKRPLKRGPSKGYIKDLERRLNSLESQIVTEEKLDDDEYLHSDEQTDATTAKPKVRAEDRISRLESALGRAPKADVDETDLEPQQPAETVVTKPLENTRQIAPQSATPHSPQKPLKTATRAQKGDRDLAEVKSKVMQSHLHGTFPVLPFRDATSKISQLEERVPARGMRLLLDPVETSGLPKSMEGHTGSADIRNGTPVSSKTKTHSARIANLIGQASAGLGSTRDDLALQSRPSSERLRAMSKIAHQLSGQEADLLMLCHLDHLRNGHNNNSALAAAVSKLGSGSYSLQNDDDSYRRRTLLFMLDRWHALAFGTPHLLTGRFGMESRTFQSMKNALGDVSGSSLGDAVYEILRAAVMVGQLGDLAQNAGGWKHVSLSDVDAVIHSATDENETESRRTDDEIHSLLDATALRYSLESMVRCYHAMHVLPLTTEAGVNDVHRVLKLAESIVVLGSVKTPISLQGKLLQCAVGPHVLAVAGIGFSWCLRVICRLVSVQAHADATDSVSESPCMALEHCRRKILDYVRMCGPFCMFSGGSATDTGSFKGVYLRMALFFNQIVGLATQMGTLVTTLPTHSPARADPTALAAEADTLVELVNELGPLGYVLSSTSPREAWRLIDP